MSLSKRLYNHARAELKAALRRFDEPATADFDEPYQAPPVAASPTAMNEPAEVSRWYGNLELPLGASAAEVRAAYRRMMRRYHPDRQGMDPKREEVATELTRELRAAYEGLLAHLGEEP